MSINLEVGFSIRANNNSGIQLNKLDYVNACNFVAKKTLKLISFCYIYLNKIYTILS
jgi:hypothetical protein